MLDTEQGGKKAQCPSGKIKADTYRGQVNGMWPHVGGAEGWWWREVMDDKLTKWGWKENTSPSYSLSDEELYMFGEMGDRYFRSLLKTL